MLIFEKISVDTALYSWAMELLNVSFPSSERRDDDMQRLAMQHPDYRLCAIVQGEKAVGLVGLWETSDFLYLENFCVVPKLRNMGYGSQTLQQLKNCGKPFVLEMEIPCDQITNRRKGFYERNGMRTNPYKHIQAHYRKTDDDLELVVMSYPDVLTQLQYDNFNKYLRDNLDVR